MPQTPGPLAAEPPLRQGWRTIGWAWMSIGLLTIGVGGWQYWQRMQASAAPRRLAESFATALQQGDRASALKLLTPEMQRKARIPANKIVPGAWEAAPDLTWKIEVHDVTPTSATAKVSFDEHRYKLTAQLTLKRTSAQGWQVNDIELTHIDRRWETAQRLAEYEAELKQAKADDALAHELQQAILNLNKVEHIARTPADDRPGPPPRR